MVGPDSRLGWVRGAAGAAGPPPASAASRRALVLGILLLLVCVYTILGGMLSVLVTDFVQFIVMSLGLLVSLASLVAALR